LNGAVLQVLLILAFLAIGLISVTFPVYAISVNFLPKQKWEDEKERKKRMDNLEAKIKELTARLGSGDANTEAIKEQLDKYKAEKEGTELRYNHLTAQGAVLEPVIALILALLFAVVGIYGFYKDLLGVTIVLGFGSSVFSLAAISRLYKTISAVEYGALRPERTVEFNVGFGLKKDKKISIQLGKITDALWFVETPESDVENLYILVKFPAELEVGKSNPSPGINVSKYEDYVIIRKTVEYLPKGRGTGFSFQVISKKKGKYTVNALVCAKGIYEYSQDLTIEVV
jgi:hypothetical protein